MTPYEAYKLYLALHNHFTLKSYDYFKYNGRVKATIESYNSRKDKWIFEKLAKQPNLKEYLVANLLHNVKFWPGDFDISERFYKQYAKRHQSISYLYEQDLKKLDSNVRDLVMTHERQLPLLLQNYLQHKISLETVCIILDTIKALPAWSKYYKDDFVMEHYILLIKKYTPFIKFDKDVSLKLLKKYCIPSKQDL